MAKKPVAKKPVAKKPVESVPEIVTSKNFGASEVRAIPMDKIALAPKDQQVRPFDPGDAEYQRKVEFARGNRKWISPLVVKKDGSNYVLVDGRNRYEASKVNGWTEVEAQVFENLDVASALQVGLIQNLRSKSMTPTEISVACAAIMKHDPGANIKTMAVGMNCTPNTVRNYLRLGNLVDGAKRRVNKGEIAAANAYMLAQLPQDVQNADDGAWINSAAKTKTTKFVRAVQDFLKDLKGDSTGATRKSSKERAAAAPDTPKALGQRGLEEALADAMEANPKIVGEINESYQDGLIDGLLIALGKQPLLPATRVAGFQPRPASARTN